MLVSFRKNLYVDKLHVSWYYTTYNICTCLFSDVKFQLHLCYVHYKQFGQATGILESIPAKQRTVKVNMALGRLYQQCGTERPAITAYKEVLRVRMEQLSACCPGFLESLVH